MIGHIKSGQYLKNIARAILKKYCPPCHKAGILDFILATKSSVWIIMGDIVQFLLSEATTNLKSFIFSLASSQNTSFY